MQALDTYRETFRASERCAKPWAMAGFNVFAAETDEEGHRLRSSARQSTLALRRGRPGRLPPPDDGFEAHLSPRERAMLDEQGVCSAVGSPATVLGQMERFVERTGVDELMVNSMIFDHDARVRSFEIAMEVWRSARGGGDGGGMTDLRHALTAAPARRVGSSAPCATDEAACGDGGGTDRPRHAENVPGNDPPIAGAKRLRTRPWTAGLDVRPAAAPSSASGSETTSAASPLSSTNPR